MVIIRKVLSKDAGIIEIEKPEIQIVEEYAKKEISERELKILGFYLTEHPIDKYRNKYNIYSRNINCFFDKNVKIVVMVSKIKETTTKNNDIMAFITASDEYGSIDLTIFPLVYKRFNDIKIGDIIEVIGHVEKRYDKYQVIVNNIRLLEGD